MTSHNFSFCHCVFPFFSFLSFRGTVSHYLWAVVGPFKINGVPLRRVNQAYVIATSTKVDISAVSAEKFDDKYFTKEKKKKKNKGESEFFETEKVVCLHLFILPTISCYI